ncbi:hypothetical protein FGG90_03540 [Clavibacter tessellarius]|uniref:Uncharacterized protein n=1 Tax=Clavibacter tessellarius TaxID=31965 RepID=A0A225CAU4_9MICO|nr:hypothetical protein [Clavibacter michiganensis]OQJ63877.1 hypothetical protein B5P24_13170 [Clavibacter michiganensis subsp. tessellarius]UKF33145.1 hypothetical protein FGG90_03540 [Clavibacter michiganensis subsp. tessellarius]
MDQVIDPLEHHMSHATLHGNSRTDPHRASVVGSAVLGFLAAFVVGATVIVTLLITSFAQATEGYPGLDVPGVVDTRIDHGSVITQIGPGGFLFPLAAGLVVGLIVAVVVYARQRRIQD